MHTAMEQMGAVQLFESEPGRLYTIEAAAHLAGVPRRTLLLYCKEGIIQASTKPDCAGLFFDERAIHTIRRAEDLRNLHAMDLKGVRLVFELMEEVESLRQELRFWRQM